MTKLQELKVLLKGKAKDIRTNRAELKEAQRNHKSSIASRLQWTIPNLSRDYRYHHIAYCELRGRTREQIETPNSDNLPSETAIQKIKEEYAYVQDVCACEV